MSRDTPLSLLLSKAGELILLNLLAAFCALPVITAGASVSAMYAVLLQMERQEHVPIIATFFAAFRRNFLQATALETLIALAAVFAWTDLRFALGSQGSMRSLYLAVGTIVALLTLIVQTFALPQQAIYSNSIAGYLKNSFFLAFCAPGRMVLCWAVWILPWLLAFVSWELFVKLGALYFMWGFSFPAWVTAKLLNSLFKRIEA